QAWPWARTTPGSHPQRRPWPRLRRRRAPAWRRARRGVRPRPSAGGPWRCPRRRRRRRPLAAARPLDWPEPVREGRWRQRCACRTLALLLPEDLGEQRALAAAGGGQGGHFTLGDDLGEGREPFRHLGLGIGLE